MSRLTEIMKQIPLDELTGDVEMKERNERNIKVTSGGGGGMVGRRIGLIGTAAACAVLAAGGVFAYSKLSKSPEDKRATNITSTVEGHSEAYKRNLAIYKTYYEKSISADFSLVERNTAPLEEDSPVTEFEGLKLRVIGTRSLGSFIRVDVGVENPDGKRFHVRPSDDVKLILPDGSSISGCGCNSVNDRVLLAGVNYIMRSLALDTERLIREILTELASQQDFSVCRLEQSISDIRLQKLTLGRKLASGTISDADYAELNTALNAELSSLETELEQLPKAAPDGRIEDILRRKLTFAEPDIHICGEALIQAEVCPEKELSVKLKGLPCPVRLRYSTSGKGAGFAPHFELL